jgi:GH15 family glucan-1,4-alpha-glucosidase
MVLERVPMTACPPPLLGALIFLRTPPCGGRGSIDFLCAPRFDSASVFAALLDDERDGRFQLAPILEGARQKQLYLPDTCVLLTRFLSAEGVAEVSDFMPIGDGRQAHDVVRRAKTVRGEVRFRMVCQPRFDYARATHTAEQTVDGVRFIAGSGSALAFLLRSSIPVRIVDGAAVAEFTLRADESASFVFEQMEPGGESPSGAPDYVTRAFKDTVNFWRGWVGRSTYRGRWREMVNRSALTLKLLTSRPFGSIVAAATFGLPEWVGGGRNWDYRHTWIRDASFTLYGLIRLGFTGEAEAFMRWVEDRCAELEPAPDHVRHRRPQDPDRGEPSSPGGLQGLPAGPHRQPGPHPPPARHLPAFACRRRAAGAGARFSRPSWRWPPTRKGRSRSRWTRRVIIEPRLWPERTDR